MIEPLPVCHDELCRLPGLFRRWELSQVLDPGHDYRIEDAGATSDGAPLFAIYKGIAFAAAASSSRARR